MKISLCFLLVLFSLKGFSESPDFSAFEEKIEKQIRNEGKSPQDKYYIYALFARELLGLKELALAEKYYEKALSQDAAEPDKSEAYFNLLFIAHVQKDSAKIRKRFKNIKDAINQKILPVQSQKQLELWNSILSDSTAVEQRPPHSFYGAYHNDKKFKALVTEGKYKEALYLLPSQLEQANINLKIQKDILQKAVFPDTKKLLCEQVLKRYPNSFTYSMMICRYLRNKKSVKLDEIKRQIQEESPQKLYLMKPLGEIK